MLNKMKKKSYNVYPVNSPVPFIRQIIPRFQLSLMLLHRAREAHWLERLLSSRKVRSQSLRRGFESNCGRERFFG